MAFPLIGALIEPLSSVVNTVLKRVLPEDPEVQRRAQSEVLQAMTGTHVQELQSAMAIIVAESQGGLLARNWRPIVMLTFTGLVSAHWLGLTPTTLPSEQVTELLAIVKLGLGGYVIGRSVEKVAPSIISALKK